MFYNQLEEPLKLIHKRFVSLDEGEVNKTKPLVRKVSNVFYNVVYILNEHNGIKS